MDRRLFSVVACLAALASCRSAPRPSTSSGADEAPIAEAPRAHATRGDEPVRVETVDVPGDLPAFVLRGARGARKMVFLHGRCTHALGYVQSFQAAAAAHGTVLGLQGDESCGGPFRRWSLDVDAIDRRIDAAFRAAGEGDDLRDVAVIGYSEGAVRAEMLAARRPDRYTRAILIGGPTTPSVARLRDERAVVLLAGDKDNQVPMRTGERLLGAAGVASAFLTLPDARHGQMGPEGDRTMADALAFAFSH